MTSMNALLAGRYMTSRMPFARIAILKWAVQNMALIGSTKWPDMMKYSATIEQRVVKQLSAFWRFTKRPITMFRICQKILR